MSKSNVSSRKSCAAAGGDQTEVPGAGPVRGKGGRGPSAEPALGEARVWRAEPHQPRHGEDVTMNRFAVRLIMAKYSTSIPSAPLGVQPGRSEWEYGAGDDAAGLVDDGHGTGSDRGWPASGERT